MSDETKVSQLLAAALQGAADVARGRLGREVRIEPAEPLAASAILRFDLPFVTGGRLAWFIGNDDATGLSDLLIGGSGDRSAVLTELHLDALTSAFSDMFTRAVDAMALNVDEPLQSGEIDLGMEGELPPLDPGATRVVCSLNIEGFGPLVVVQQADPDLSQWLELHGLVDIVADSSQLDAGPAAAAAAEVDDVPAPAGPEPVDHHAVLDHAASVAAAAVASVPADNVIPLTSASAAVHEAMPLQSQSPRGDLDMLMNVPLPLTVELGSAQRTIRELVDFSIGSIIELGKLAGDPLDIKVNDRVIARGEVVVIDEEFGIRVTEIVSPEDRIRDLG